VAPSHSFAIVIPAHNEETTLPRALESCAALDYPKEKIAVYVIADNCTDRTAEVAWQHGAACLVRQDEQKRGKGFALEWALPQLLADGREAVVVLDADCTMDSHALLAFDRHLAGGARVLQASYVVGNPDASPISYILALANVLENDCYFAPKSVLGLAVMLRGTGMVLHRDVLLQFPWRAQSVTEDSEYSYQLLKKGIRVRFLNAVRVASDFPVTRDQLTTQRNRWIAGIRTGVPQGIKLFWHGILTRRLALIDAGFNTLMAGRFLVILQWVATVALAIVCMWAAPAGWGVAFLCTTLAVALGYVAYIAGGVVLLGLNMKRIWLLMHIPVVTTRYLQMAVLAIIRSGAAKWNRTPRS
jgi:cellulose synthase/poly-beta-1,6-N-acetylglucosamine synthase-like glycosyltransferase